MYTILPKLNSLPAKPIMLGVLLSWFQCVIKYKDLWWWLLLLQSSFKAFWDHEIIFLQEQPPQWGECSQGTGLTVYTGVKLGHTYVLHLPRSLSETSPFLIQVYYFTYIHLFERSLSVRCWTQQWMKLEKVPPVSCLHPLKLQPAWEVFNWQYLFFWWRAFS